MKSEIHPVDEILPVTKLFTLGLQHVLVMYAGAIAVPLIVGRVLKLEPQDVAFLILADLFVCGVLTLIQSFGMTRWFGIHLPVMMGVTFASVGPMIAIGTANPGVEGARLIFGSIICAGLIAILIVFGLMPKMGALVEALPVSVLGGAGLVMFGMVAATGIRILAAGVDFATNRHNLFIVAISLGFGMIPLIAADFKMWLPHGIHPLIESGILLATIASVSLNAFFNGASGTEADLRRAAEAIEH